MSGFFWESTPEEEFGKGIDQWSNLLKSSLAGLCARYAILIEAWLRANASWEDDTGDARAQLTAEVFSLGEEISLDISHGVDYGRYLEFSNSGRYAIISPALDYWAPKLIQEIETMLG